MLILFKCTCNILKLTFCYRHELYCNFLVPDLKKTIISGILREHVRATSTAGDTDAPLVSWLQIIVFFLESDLKKTMAVLLESMLERLARLETQMHHVFNGSNSSLLLNMSSLAQGDGHPLHAEGGCELKRSLPRDVTCFDLIKFSGLQSNRPFSNYFWWIVRLQHHPLRLYFSILWMA